MVRHKQHYSFIYLFKALFLSNYSHHIPRPKIIGVVDVVIIIGGGGGGGGVNIVVVAVGVKVAMIY